MDNIYIDIDPCLYPSESQREFNRRLFSYIMITIGRTSIEIGNISSIDVGSKLLDVFYSINEIRFIEGNHIDSEVIGKMYNNVSIIFNKKIYHDLMGGEFEYHLILNIIDGRSIMVYINRDLQKERDNIIDNILE